MAGLAARAGNGSRPATGKDIARLLHFYKWVPGQYREEACPGYVFSLA